MADIAGLLVKVAGDGAAFTSDKQVLGLKAGSVEPILNMPSGPVPGMAAQAGQGATWLKIGADFRNSQNPWDDAHAIADRGSAFAAAGGAHMLEIEPDLIQQWDYKDGGSDHGMAAAAVQACVFDDQDGSGRKSVQEGVAWNAGPDFSQFKAARSKVGNKQDKIIVAHLDTGVDPKHQTLPAGIVSKELWRNFVDDGYGPNDAVDHAPAGGIASNRGHGTGTLSLLAGNRLDGTSPGWPGFSDYVGAAPLVRIIPIRVANWVVRFSTSTLVQGFDYARQQGAHVLSMSMGGLSSAALVDAVNLAYEHGVVMVTAAGNNYAYRPSPKSIVFPARYQRVLAACGVMSDGRSYSGLASGTMQGNYGPDSKMATALGAFTPNVPWAEIDCGKIVDMDGAGTSAATPQIAAAAALWLAEHWSTVKNYPEPWMRVEAVRYALFSTARKSTAKMNAQETLEKIGQGVLRAEDALAVLPLAANKLGKLKPATDSWSWLNLLIGGGVSLAPNGAAAQQKQRMLALELTQMAQRVASVDRAISDPDADPATIPAVARNRYLEAALDDGNPSKPLRAVLEAALRRPGAARTAVSARSVAPPIPRKPRSVSPPARRLRVYALDPALGKKLESVAVHQATLSIPWDDERPDGFLTPGPVGEYIEVVDVDPASNRVYDPVDLNHKRLLAQDGLAPSEGNPQFHQQMVYAVAMATIGHFERALGRRALWAPRYASYVGHDGDRKLKGYEVPRLRIYPHGLRMQNAYYSPDKKALLFGYFPADSGSEDATAPGSMVFSCLSFDIIAHETSHALLDGLHRRFQEASNPDVPAFHEGFADIVALFQHFTMKELVSFEISRTRGNLSAVNLLSGLALQFGEGSGRSGPLRDYAKPKMAELDYDKTFEPHDRGSILVFAVYDAFQAIVARRTQSLIQLATGGSGILPAGALHPGLVERLTEDVVKTARSMLDMCIRALDYCPAVDITFGEYLRAVITADLDVFPEDTYNYRLAFMDSFRKWKLLPRDVRTVSEETLTWDTPAVDTPWLEKILEDVDLGWDRKLTRSKIFEFNESNRWKIWAGLKDVLLKNPEMHAHFGLLPHLPRFRDDGTLFRKPDKGATTFDVYGVRPTRRVEPDGSCRTEVIVTIQQRVPLHPDGTMALDGVKAGEEFLWFRGGATMIIDPRKGQEEIRYSIIKNTGSDGRQKRQAQAAAAHYMSPLRALYFGETKSEPFAMLHADHGGHDHD